MSTELKRLGIVLIIASFLFGCFPLFRVEVNAESKKTIKFSADMGADSNGKYNGKVSVKFNGDIFKKMNVDNKDLALLAASMSAASCKQGGEPQHSGAYFLGNAYKTLGFKKNNVYIFNYKKNKGEDVFGEIKTAKDKNGNSLKNEHCFGIGVKEMNIGGTETCVMIISLRGTESSWKNLNEVFGDVTYKDYTRNYRDKVIAGIKQYINDHSELNNKPIKILVTGHSLGGGAANLVGAMKLSTWNKMGWKKQINKSDIVTFTFGAINVFDKEEKSKVHGKKYDNILNYFNYYDFFGPNGNKVANKLVGGGESCIRKYGKMRIFIQDCKKDFKKAKYDVFANHNMPGYVKAAAEPVVLAPSDTEITSIKGGKNKISLKWNRINGVKGYQLQYSKNKDFSLLSKKYNINLLSDKYVTETISKLKQGTKYYTRIRTYKTINKTKYYSPWSKVKSAKTKDASKKTGTVYRLPAKVEVQHRNDTGKWENGVTFKYKYNKYNDPIEMIRNYPVGRYLYNCKYEYRNDNSRKNMTYFDTDNDLKVTILYDKDGQRTEIKRVLRQSRDVVGLIRYSNYVNGIPLKIEEVDDKSTFKFKATWFDNKLPKKIELLGEYPASYSFSKKGLELFKDGKYILRNGLVSVIQKGKKERIKITYDNKTKCDAKRYARMINSHAGWISDLPLYPLYYDIMPWY